MFGDANGVYTFRKALMECYVYVCPLTLVGGNVAKYSCFSLHNSTCPQVVFLRN